MEKNKLMMVVIIALLVILLGTIVGISLYVINTVNTSGEDTPDITPAPITEPRIEDIQLLDIGKIATNLLTEGTGNHVISASFSLGINGLEDADGVFLELLKAKIDIVRDIVISVVGNTTYTDIRSVNGKERLKENILEKVRETFQSNMIWEVYMYDYVDQ